MKEITRIASVAVLAAALWSLGSCGGDQPPPAETPPAPIAEAGEPAPAAEPTTAEGPDAEPSPAPAAPASAADPVPAPASEPAPAPAPATELEPTPAPVAEFEGTMVSRKAKLAIVEIAATDGIAAGAKAELYKYFEQKLGPFSTSGWLDIAAVTVKEVKGSKVHLTVDEEKSDMTVNGKKVNHFVKGNKIKLEIAP